MTHIKIKWVKVGRGGGAYPEPLLNNNSMLKENNHTVYCQHNTLLGASLEQVQFLYYCITRFTILYFLS